MNDFENIRPTIKHLVIASGVMYGLSFYGSLKELAINNVWNINNIDTIFATSAGTIVAVLISLKYDWDIMDNYIINRPWHHVFQININTIMSAFQSSGIFDIMCIREIFTPLFKGRDLEIDITMREFKEYTGIDFHFFATRIDTFDIFDINAESCPDWTVIEAVYASSAAPILFQPFIKDGITYADGAFFAKYPLLQSLNWLKSRTNHNNNNIVDTSEILGIYLDTQSNNSKLEESEENKSLSKDSTNNESIIFSPLFHYLHLILLKLVSKMASPIITIPNQICVIPKEFRLNYIYSVVNSKQEREELIIMGMGHSRDKKLIFGFDG